MTGATSRPASATSTPAERMDVPPTLTPFTPAISTSAQTPMAESAPTNLAHTGTTSAPVAAGLAAALASLINESSSTPLPPPGIDYNALYGSQGQPTPDRITNARDYRPRAVRNPSPGFIKNLLENHDPYARGGLGYDSDTEGGAGPDISGPRDTGYFAHNGLTSSQNAASTAGSSSSSGSERSSKRSSEHLDDNENETASTSKRARRVSPDGYDETLRERTSRGMAHPQSQSLASDVHREPAPPKIKLEGNDSQGNDLYNVRAEDHDEDFIGFEDDNTHVGPVDDTYVSPVDDEPPSASLCHL